MLSRLNSRERGIVERVVRDRIGSNESIQAQFFKSQHPTSVTRVTAKLVQAGWLNAYPLIYPSKYFIPGKRAIAAYGLSASRGLPLGPQSLPTEYALLQYTSKTSESLTRLSGQEVIDKFGWYRGEWLFAPHCLRSEEGKHVLELVRVDLGGPADHIARKCRDDVERRQLDTQFAELLKRGQFALIVITGATEKAAVIKTALDKHIWPSGMRFRLASFMSLIPLLPRSY